ncbi:ADP-ribosylation factor GTPase-activating protein AGD2 [Morus notabilis]|uniref:ADP-ribosylation factor GTPase-activating protein AGD2 n=1 Tax=Morus notabilis TaxID=981085 RepID=W9SAE5_9ROSA|nr:ADP-ribosylation factor GTPase-activating protein AGD2 [Morus notabilis]
MVARSSAEAELRALAQGICELLWLKRTMNELSLQSENPMLYCDNKSAISIAHYPIHHDRTKHVEVDRHFIREKVEEGLYVEKLLVIRDESVTERPACSTSIWEAVKSNNLQEVYRLIVLSDMNIINTTFDNVFDVDLHHHVEAQESISGRSAIERKHFDPESCDRIKNSNEPGNCLQGCSLLHLACHSGNLQMIELLLQFGTDINLRDFHGRTPLHHCISSAKNPLAKFLLRRGARPSIKDGGGLSSLERAMEMGAITDEELFILLTECE